MTTATAETPPSRERSVALALLFVMPLFFSTNIIFGRASIDGGHTEPYTLAFLRWTFTALILLPFVWPKLRTHRALIGSLTPTIAMLGFLGMWICGALVYVALKYTSATNGTLIYTTAPVMVLVIDWLFRGRKTNIREAAGIGLAFSGVGIIVFRGSLETLLSLSFNVGDLIFVATAFSWAVYSVWLKSDKLAPLQTLPLFALTAGAGAVLLLPFAAFETVSLATFPSTLTAWALISATVIISSLLAFSLFQNGVRVVGSSITSIFLYLLPVYGVALAVLFLGETLFPFHFWGIATVLSGVVLATFPARKKA
ncbi:DMT family transporter [Pseudahrensia aquimaris]|uniref:DMT family transporter n=1 Tax=Pseudahrensia aquimaris TaxID=744461 RepID=A0ABW3FJV1_9HYPH